MVKVIIFDLGGVLFTNGTKKFIKTLSQRYGLNEEKVKDVMDGDLGSQYREAKIIRDEFWQRALTQLGITSDIDALESEWIDGYDLIEGTRDIIFELAQNYTVYYLSDNVRERVDRIDAKYGFKRWFKDGVFSHEVGVRKPHPKIYEVTLKNAGVKPEEAVFIDDKESALVPAAEMGIITILFKDPDDLRRELEKIKVL